MISQRALRDIVLKDGRPNNNVIVRSAKTVFYEFMDDPKITLKSHRSGGNAKNTPAFPVWCTDLFALIAGERR